MTCRKVIHRYFKFGGSGITFNKALKIKYAMLTQINDVKKWNFVLRTHDYIIHTT